ncbi:MAG TPA: DUF4252 domain-containing protein [Bacteroidales bacterium]|nr:DUF4252 domain-containing protein [Bacteroidales bacterium]
MKKLALILILTVSVAWPAFVSAQSPIDKVFEKYAGQEGFTSVNISKEMFQMFGQMLMDKKDTDAIEMKKMMDQLNGLKLLTYTVDSTQMSKAVTIYNEFAGLFPASAYKELMTVNEGRENYKFLTRQDGAGKITELVMLMKGKHEVMVISMTGNIDLSSISKITKGMNIKGMENLDKLKEHPKN